jgi:hypothetical protein
MNPMMKAALMGILGRRASAAAWPYNMSGTIRLDLDADVGIVLNGSNVASWADQSSFANHCSQANPALQPARTLAWRNGHNAVSPNGSSYLNGSTTLYAAGAARSVFIWGESTAAIGGCLFSFKTSTPNLACYLLFTGGDSYVSGDGVTPGGNCTVNTIAFKNSPFGSAHAFRGTGLAPKVYGNGTELTALVGTQQATESGTAGYNVGSGGIVPWPFQGHIARIVVMDGVASPADVVLARAYGQARYLTP